MAGNETWAVEVPEVRKAFPPAGHPPWPLFCTVTETLTLQPGDALSGLMLILVMVKSGFTNVG